MHITVERMAKEGPFSDEQDMLLARFTVQDADPSAWSAKQATLRIGKAVRAMRHLNQKLLNLTPTTASAEGKPGDVWVTIPIPRLLAEDLGFDLAAELAPEIAEAYVMRCKTQLRRDEPA